MAKKKPRRSRKKAENAPEPQELLELADELDLTAEQFMALVLDDLIQRERTKPEKPKGPDEPNIPEDVLKGIEYL